MNMYLKTLIAAFSMIALSACSEPNTPVSDMPDPLPLLAVPADPLIGERNSDIIGVNYVGLTVSDAPEMAAYFEKTAGMDVLPIKDVAILPGMPGTSDGDSGEALTLRGRNSFVRLMEFDQVLPSHKGGQLPVQGPGITHICFIAPKSKPIDGRFVEHGGQWVSSTNAMVDMRGVGYMYGYLRTPDGTMIEIEHAPDPKIDTDVWMSHVALVTHDLTRLLEFYEKVFGYPHYRRVDNISGTTFDQVGGLEGAVINGAWFRIAPFYALELWQYDAPATQARTEPPAVNQAGYNQIVFETTDIDAAFERVKSHDIELLSDVKHTEDARSFYFRDPDGNLLGFTELETGSPQSLESLNFSAER